MTVGFGEVEDVVFWTHDLAAKPFSYKVIMAPFARTLKLNRFSAETFEKSVYAEKNQRITYGCAALSVASLIGGRESNEIVNL